MFNKLEILQMAGQMARHASARQSTIAQNVANADTPGYRARDVASFADSYERADDDFTMRQTRAGHLVSDASDSGLVKTFDTAGPSSPNGNTVSLETEMMKTAEVRHEHDTALAIYKSSLDILRAAVGRR